MILRTLKLKKVPFLVPDIDVDMTLPQVNFTRFTIVKTKISFRNSDYLDPIVLELIDLRRMLLVVRISLMDQETLEQTKHFFVKPEWINPIRCADKEKPDYREIIKEFDDFNWNKMLDQKLARNFPLQFDPSIEFFNLLSDPEST